MSKKLIALVLAFALVFSSIPVAFADTAIPADAQAAKDLGMLVGSGNGVTIEYLQETPSRLQAAIMYLRLKGLEETALSYTGTDNFDDAEDMMWVQGRNILAYLKAHPELGFIGIGGNKFNGEAKIDAASYYKVMLEALGYKQGVDFQWEDVIEFAAEKGLVKVANVTNFTVNDLATATIEALKATVKGESKTLIAKLVETGVISEAAAIASGIYTPVPAELAVVSVKVTNLKETVVNFNKEVDKDSAEDAENYLLNDEDIAGTVKLNADKKSVTITWTTKLDNQTEYDLTISDIIAADGTVLEEVTVNFLANDVTLPVAEKITLVGPNKFEIKFNEPIAEKGNVTVTDADYDYEVADITVDGNVVIVELSDEELEEGNYNVEITNFVDYAGLKSLKKTLTLAYEKDTTAPVATIKEATQTKVVVEFNKPVYNGDAEKGETLTADFFYHTYTSYKPVYVQVSDNNKKFTLYFTKDAAIAAGVPAGEVAGATDRPLAEGNVKFVIVADADDNITDEWGNEVEDNMTFTLTISADTTAPAVTKVVVEDQKTILVYFSEDVVAEQDNFTVVDEDGEEVEIASFDYEVTSDDEYVVTLGFATALEGEYSITVKDVVDKALEANKIAKTTKKVTVADKTAPDLSKVEVIGIDSNDNNKADYIYVTFPEDMATSGAYSVLNKDNFQIKTSDGKYHDLKANDKIATFGGNDKIKITIADSTLYNVEDGSIELVIGRVADALGNKVTEFNVAKAVEAEDSPIVAAVKTIDKKTIEITLDKEVKTVNKAWIQVSKDGDEFVSVYSIKTWTVKDGETIITAVLPAALYLEDSADKDIYVKVVADKFETVFGTKMDEFTFDAAGVEDGFAPSVVKDGIEVTANKTFTITFDENLDASIAALYAQDLVVKNAKGDVLVAGVDYTTSVAGKVITVTIADGAKTGDYKVYSNSTIKYIRDAAGNKANAFTTSVTLEDLVK